MTTRHEKILVDLAARVLVAKDGLGEWRPMQRAVSAMVADGCDVGLAAMSAEAVANLAADVRRLPAGQRLRGFVASTPA